MLRMVFFLKGSIGGGHTGSVSTPTALSAGRDSLAGASVGNYALFGGGTDNESIFTTVDAYNMSLTRAEKAAIIKPVVVEPIIKEIKK